MTRNTSMKNTLVNAFRAAAPFGALFSSDPGTTGSATPEISGGTYTRLPMNWSAANNGSTSSASTVFNVPAGVTVAYFGATASSTSGTNDVQDSAAITAQTFSTAGTYTVSAVFAQN
jgi:hypothetical protein